jgi:DMSO reductase anchor subunit
MTETETRPRPRAEAEIRAAARWRRTLTAIYLLMLLGIAGGTALAVRYGRVSAVAGARIAAALDSATVTAPLTRRVIAQLATAADDLRTDSVQQRLETAQARAANHAFLHAMRAEFRDRLEEIEARADTIQRALPPPKRRK